MKQMIAFDLDGTLAESKQPVGTAMAAVLKSLLDVASVAVISGGDWPQLKSQVVERLSPESALDKLFIMPTTGTKLYRFDGVWRPIFAEIFGEAKRKEIMTALDTASSSIDLTDTKIWGERVEDRGSQITFSGLGQEAPIDAKKAWDPSFTKRKQLQTALQQLLPDLSINVGGSTSIDITQKGVDKAYGMRKLAEHSGVALEAMLFLGDAIYPGGNDYAVHAAGIDTIKVRDVDETIAVVTAIIACLGH